jgi:hypothetical protein
MENFENFLENFFDDVEGIKERTKSLTNIISPAKPRGSRKLSSLKEIPELDPSNYLKMIILIFFFNNYK